MDKQPIGDEIQERDAQAVSGGERDAYQHAVPARRHHEIERQVADGVQVALRARREEILAEAPGDELKGKVIVVVELIPVDVLAGVHRPGRAKDRRQAEHEPCRCASHARFAYLLLRDLRSFTRSPTPFAAASFPILRYCASSSLKAELPGDGQTDTDVSRSRTAPGRSPTFARSTPRI